MNKSSTGTKIIYIERKEDISINPVLGSTLTWEATHNNSMKKESSLRVL
jgi:hypothetical protein